MSEEVKPVEEVVDNRTPEEITKQIELEQMAQVSPIEAASTAFGMYYPKYCAAVDKLSAKSLRRLVKAIVGYPLEEVKLSMKNPEEMQVFYVAEELMKAKTVLFIDSMYQQQIETQKQLAETQAQADATEAAVNEARKEANEPT